jgi:hypothetical protein
MEFTISNIPILTDFLEFKDKLSLCQVNKDSNKSLYLNTQKLRQKIALRKIRFFLDRYVINEDDYYIDEDTEWHKPSIVKLYMREYFEQDCYKSFAFFCNWKLEDDYQNFLEDEMPEIMILAQREEITRREFFNLIKKLVNYREVLEYLGL